MDTQTVHATGHGIAVTEHAPQCRPAPKWAALLNDQLFPMSRRRLSARDILDQAGIGPESVLVRDHNSPNDVVLADDDAVDLAEGNVFRAIPRCEAAPRQHCTAPAKLAFVADDMWEVTVTSRQTGHSLKRLLGLPDDAEVFRDLESPNDQPIRDDEVVHFADGPVFTVRSATITVTVNNQKVSFTKRRVTGLQIKEAAISQGVKIEPSFVLYPVKPDGGLGAAIGDDKLVTLKECDAFSCVAPDDNS